MEYCEQAVYSSDTGRAEEGGWRIHWRWVLRPRRGQYASSIADGPLYDIRSWKDDENLPMASVDAYRLYNMAGRDCICVLYECIERCIRAASGNSASQRLDDLYKGGRL